MHIRGRGALLIPILELPKVSGFTTFKGSVEVSLPDGKKKKYSAQFELMHFMMNIVGKLTGRWKIVILIPKANKSEIPIESEVNVTEDIASRLMYIKLHSNKE